MTRSMFEAPEDDLDAAIRREATATRVEVEASADTDAAWEQFERDLEAGAGRPPSTPHRTRRPIMVISAAMVAAAVVAIVVVNVRREPSPTDRLPTPATTVDPQRVTTSAPATTEPGGPSAGLTLPTASPFSPITSLSAVSDREWWAATGVQLQHTVDGGTTWVTVPIVDANATGARADEGVTGYDAQWVHFADARNGWILTTDVAATHDGGATWTYEAVQPRLADGFPPAIQSRDGDVHLLADGYAGGNSAIVVSSGSTDRVGFSASDFTMGDIGRWAIFPNSAQLALQRDTGWAIAYGLSTGGSARLVDGTWVEWSPPCARELPPPSSSIVGVPVAHLLLAASPEGSDVAVVCVEREGDLPRLTTGPVPVSVFLSHDGGATFGSAIPLPADVGMVWDPVAMDARPWVLVPADGTVLIGTPLTNGDLVIESSTDGGVSWQVVTSFGPQTNFGPVTVTPTGRVVVVVNSVARDGTTVQTARISDDGGTSWTPVPFG